MKKENETFLDAYKNIDNYLKDKRNTQTGITTYIEDLEKLNNDKYHNTLKILKDLRYKRNKLAHELSLEEDYITKDDLRNLNDFVKSVTNKTDPLAKKRMLHIDSDKLKLKLFPIILILLIVSILINLYFLFH